MSEIMTQVLSIAEQQGWTDDSLGAMALSFLADSVDPQTQRAFVAHLHEVQSIENGN